MLLEEVDEASVDQLAQIARRAGDCTASAATARADQIDAAASLHVHDLVEQGDEAQHGRLARAVGRQLD